MNLELQKEILLSQARELELGNETEKHLACIYLALAGGLTFGGKMTELIIAEHSSAAKVITENVLRQINAVKAQRN